MPFYHTPFLVFFAALLTRHARIEVPLMNRR